MAAWSSGCDQWVGRASGCDHWVWLVGGGTTVCLLNILTLVFELFGSVIPLLLFNLLPFGISLVS